MTSEEALKAGETAIARDPRKAPYGYLAGGSFVLDHSRVFMWFESVGEMADYLLDAEPVLFDFEGEDLENYDKAARPVLEQLKIAGFSGDRLSQLNEAAKPGFVVEWWGTFAELTSGKTAFSKDLIERFTDSDEEPGSSVLPAGEMENFIEYLRAYGA